MLMIYSECGILASENVNFIINNTKNVNDCVEILNNVSDEELRIITVETGDEYAKILFKDYTILIHGGETYTNISEEILEKMKNYNGILETHSHPFKGDYMPSKADEGMFIKLTK